MREHTETVRPPRALWVTFELGRPLGIPDDAPFQRRVVKAALDLLARTDGPLIADYPEHVPEVTDFSGWACPINLAPSQIDSLAAEIDRLATWYDRVGRRPRPHDGRRLGPRHADRRRAGQPRARRASCRRRRPSRRRSTTCAPTISKPPRRSPIPARPTTRKKWFWDETRLAQAILTLQPKLAASADPQHKILANLTLIPATERHRLG